MGVWLLLIPNSQADLQPRMLVVVVVLLLRLWVFDTGCFGRSGLAPWLYLSFVCVEDMTFLGDLSTQTLQNPFCQLAVKTLTPHMHALVP